MGYPVDSSAYNDSIRKGIAERTAPIQADWDNHLDSSECTHRDDCEKCRKFRQLIQLEGLLP